jgi:two-component system sensor histidine kinase BaeS
VRTALATTFVAVLAVVLTGAIFIGQLGGVADDQARRSLGREADLVVALYERPVATADLRQGVARALGAQQVVFELLGPTGEVTTAVAGRGRRIPDLPAELRTRLAGGDQVDSLRTRAGRRLIVVTRPLPNGSTVVLLQPASENRELAASESRRLLVTLLVALAAATVVGLLLARRLSRPLRSLAGTAHQLAAGHRDVTVPATGAAEIAEVADALAGLSAALTTSERRQREFLLSVSHELRTPLTAIRGFAEALADGITPADGVPAAGRIVLDEALRLDRLVRDLLDLARLDADDFRVDLAPVDLTRIVADAADVWRPRCADAGVPLRVELPARPVVAVTDAVRCRQILDGLAENALRVAPAGVPIVFAVRVESATSTAGAPAGSAGVRTGTEVDSRDGLRNVDGVQVAGTAEGVLEVRDGGPGLTAADLAVAFERSALYERYRGSRPVSTGLGLALVARLATRLGARAEAETAAEGGAAFTIRLPLAKPAPAPPSPSALPTGGSPRPG